MLKCGGHRNKSPLCVGLTVALVQSKKMARSQMDCTERHRKLRSVISLLSVPAAVANGHHRHARSCQPIGSAAVNQSAANRQLVPPTFSLTHVAYTFCSPCFGTVGVSEPIALI